MRYFVFDSRMLLLVVPPNLVDLIVRKVCCNIWSEDIGMLMPEEFSPSVFKRFPEYLKYRKFDIDEDNIDLLFNEIEK